MTSSSDVLPLQPLSAMSDALLPSCSEDLLGVRQDRIRNVLAEHCCKAGYPSGLSTDVPVSIDMMKCNADLIRAACDRSISKPPRGPPEEKISAIDLRTPARVFRGIASKKSAPLSFILDLDAESDAEESAPPPADSPADADEPGAEGGAPKSPLGAEPVHQPRSLRLI